MSHGAVGRIARMFCAVGATVALAGAGTAAVAVPAEPVARQNPADGDHPVRPVGKKATWRLGPFHLPPAPLGTASLNRPVLEFAKPCANCFITGVTFDLTNADGTPADMNTGVMLHHVGLYDLAQPDSAQQPCTVGRPAFGSGDERAPWLVTPPGYGLEVTPAPWTGFAEVMNHSSEPREVYLNATVHHVPKSPDIKPITPIMLSVADACSGFDYDVPAGPNATSLEWTSTVTGRVVWALGHVHAGGKGLILENLTTGQRICSSEAGYGGDPKSAMANLVTSMSTCSWDSLGVVRAGDKLKLTSLYDSPRPLTAAMGLMNLGIYETDDLDGGTRAPVGMRATPDVHVPAGVTDDAGTNHGGTGGHGH